MIRQDFVRFIRIHRHPAFSFLSTDESDESIDSEDNADEMDYSGGRLPGNAPCDDYPECDDYPGDKKTDATTSGDTLTASSTPPTPTPTCTECDDEPKPTRPPSDLPLPQKDPGFASESTMPDTLLDVQTDGDEDPVEDLLLYNFGEDEASGSQSYKAVFLMSACAACLLSVWIIV